MIHNFVVFEIEVRTFLSLLIFNLMYQETQKCFAKIVPGFFPKMITQLKLIFTYNKFAEIVFRM